MIDGERYTEAEDVLEQVLKVNPHEPRAFANKAVLAHLRDDSEAEAAARQKALARWAANPEVDHLIGRKLSQKYRFAEGAARQKQALVFDRDYLPAKVQLCQDLLRLGDEEEGWRLAAEIFGKDGYNVVAYNLITLRDRLAGFRTLSGDGLVVRMEGREADLYGQRVLALLRRARKTLAERYGVTLEEPVIVEIFPQHKEFAVRTFGLPGADGLLGVCFGRVITANSPASQGEHPSNWEAVLWHEFCHVVTLSKTHNKMPRWLSEGISVYEEGREDPAWATPLDPRFRAMILGDALTPLSRLSSAFLTPKTPLDLQFAYFESALAVDFLVERYGLPAMKGLLDDLGAGMSINESLPRRTKMSLEQLDQRVCPVCAAASREGCPGRDLGRARTARRRQFVGHHGVAGEASARASRACGGLRRATGDGRKVGKGQGRSRTAEGTLSGIRWAGQRLPAAGDRLPAVVRSGRRDTRFSRSWRCGMATRSRPICG